MTGVIHGATQLFGIVGDPIVHSRSPVMQNAAFHAAGLDAVYVPFHVAPESLEAAVKGLRALGVKGWNVTIPHKAAIMPFLDEISAEAQLAGAVNVVFNQAGRLIGYNTDGSGLIASLKNDLESGVTGQHLVVLGSGGAARGAVAALCAAGAATISVVNRTLSTALHLINELAGRFPQTVLKVYPFEDLSELLPQADLLINTTSVGMKGDVFVGVQLELLPNNAKVYDMVYGTAATPLVASARQCGLMAVNGIGMLVAQGELAYQIWTGSSPIEGVMRASLEHALKSASA